MHTDSELALGIVIILLVFVRIMVKLVTVCMNCAISDTLANTEWACGKDIGWLDILFSITLATGAGLVLIGDEWNSGALLWLWSIPFMVFTWQYQLKGHDNHTHLGPNQISTKHYRSIQTFELNVTEKDNAGCCDTSPRSNGYIAFAYTVTKYWSILAVLLLFSVFLLIISIAGAESGPNVPGWVLYLVGFMALALCIMPCITTFGTRLMCDGQQTEDAYVMADGKFFAIDLSVLSELPLGNIMKINFYKKASTSGPSSVEMGRNIKYTLASSDQLQLWTHRVPDQPQPTTSHDQWVCSDPSVDSQVLESVLAIMFAVLKPDVAMRVSFVNLNINVRHNRSDKQTVQLPMLTTKPQITRLETYVRITFIFVFFLAAYVWIIIFAFWHGDGLNVQQQALQLAIGTLIILIVALGIDFSLCYTQTVTQRNGAYDLVSLQATTELQ